MTLVLTQRLLYAHEGSIVQLTNGNASDAEVIVQYLETVDYDRVQQSPSLCVKVGGSGVGAGAAAAGVTYTATKGIHYFENAQDLVVTHRDSYLPHYPHVPSAAALSV